MAAAAFQACMLELLELPGPWGGSGTGCGGGGESERAARSVCWIETLLDLRASRYKAIPASRACVQVCSKSSVRHRQGKMRKCGRDATSEDSTSLSCTDSSRVLGQGSGTAGQITRETSPHPFAFLCFFFSLSPTGALLQAPAATRTRCRRNHDEKALPRIKRGFGPGGGDGSKDSLSIRRETSRSGR